MRPQPIISPAGRTSEDYLLVEDFSFKWGEDVIVIPAGFKFDGASIPRLFWRFIGHPFTPRFIEASLVHDYLCKNKMDRKMSDRVFRKLLRANGVANWRADLMYGAVRAYAIVSRKR